MRRDSGIFVPPNYGAIIHQPDKPVVQTVDKAPPQIEVAEGPIIQEGDRSSINREYLYFLARPWDYLDSLFSECDVPSPIPEIQGKIKEVQEARKTVDPSLVVMLRSPFAYIREQAVSQLQSAGMDARQIQDLLRSDTQLIDVAKLEYSRKHTGPEAVTWTGVTALINRSADLIPHVNERNSAEAIEILKSLPQYLLVITEAIQYTTGQFRLRNPQLLDTLAAKLEGLVSQEEMPPSSALLPLCDWLSHFTFDSSAASEVLLNILESAQVNHPLRDHLAFVCNRPESDEAHHEKVGIEIECLPQIITGNLPRGFKIGVDGGGSIPEIRRCDDQLTFNNQYRDDLYELWYWARMSRLQGVSIHIHLDHTQYRAKLATYLFTEKGDSDSVRTNNPKGDSSLTVELRFPLDSYYDEVGVSDPAAQVVPFNPHQFDLSKGVRALIDTLTLSPQQAIDPLTKEYPISGLPPRWRAQIEGVRRIREGQQGTSPERVNATLGALKEVYRLSKEPSPGQTLTYNQAVRQLRDLLYVNGTLNGEQASLVIALGKKITSRTAKQRYYEQVFQAIYIGDDDPHLPISDAMCLLRNCSSPERPNRDYFESVIEFIGDGTLSLAESQSLIAYIRRRIPGHASDSILSKIKPNSLTLDEATKLAEEFGRPWYYILTHALQERQITYEMVMNLINQNAAHRAAGLVNRMPEGSLSFQQAIQIIEVMGYSFRPISNIFQALPLHERTLTGLKYLFDKNYYDSVVAAYVRSLPRGVVGWELIQKMLFEGNGGECFAESITEALYNDGVDSLSETQIMQVAVGTNNTQEAVEAAVKKAQTLSFDLLFRLHDLFGDEILAVGIPKLADTLNGGQLDQLLNQTDYDGTMMLIPEVEKSIRKGLLVGEGRRRIVAKCVRLDASHIYDVDSPAPVTSSLVPVLKEVTQNENGDFWGELVHHGLFKPNKPKANTVSALCSQTELPSFYFFSQ